MFMVAQAVCHTSLYSVQSLLVLSLARWMLHLDFKTEWMPALG